MKKRTEGRATQKKKRTSILWVTDPWKTLDHGKDTTLRLMEESVKLQARGTPIDTFWCDVKSVHLSENTVHLEARRLESVEAGRSSNAFQWEDLQLEKPDAFDRIIYRTDPPVDHAYLHPLQMIHLATRGTRSLLVNPAEMLALGNEKFEATRLGAFAPASVVSSTWEILREFGKKEGKTVLKPLHQAQSKGVELLNWNSSSEEARARELLIATTEQFSRPVILQRYLPGIEKGEQRLWFLDGKLYAAVRKLPKKGTFRIDMDRGGSLEKTALSAGEKKAAAAIGKLLTQTRIRMAAVDLIDGLVTDFNHTSPGLLTPMERILNRNLAKPIIEALIKPWTGARA